ncbi:molecular chaperone [Moesziomyces antarcticus T-34]|uniref:Molecular chaperone n=1 Tax=Pseudozyma antarctica (strain T-34) TaxID=1151754 RepID=M9MB59_PSEA3|nr:molecular chaperone [Moesziomyces antarcticus T-34]
MATSMQFGPEWMRKGPNSKSGGKESTTPSTATSPGSGPIAGNAAAPGSAGAGGGKRNGGSGGGLANLSGPAPVVSPAVSSPGAFSFAAAAAAAASAATSQGSDRNGIHASYAAGDADSSAALLNGTSAALAKDKLTREKLLSLYSTDRTSKASSAEPSPIDAAPPGPIGANAGPERAPSTSRRKVASDRRPSAFADFGAVGGGGGGPLSPALAGSEPRGLNARSTSGSSASGVAGAFGSIGASSWDKPDKERPGLFQRASSGALAGVGASTGSRPLSPSVSRDRFSGIQGGVLSGVAPPARKRMDSSDGGGGVAANSIETSSRAARIGKGGASEENGTTQPANSLGGSWGRASQAASAQPATTGASNAGFSEAFSSNRARGRNASAAADSSVTPAALTVQSSEPAQPIVPSAHPEGLSISAKFARHKDRLPGEGPIGPPSDGSIGFGKSTAGFDRRRERQASQARPVQALSASKPEAPNSNPAVSSSIAAAASAEKTGAQSADPNGNSSAAIRTLGSDDPDLAQQASAVLGSLQLDDDDDSPGLPSNSSINADQAGANNTDARHSLQSQQQQQQQPPFHSLQPPMAAAPWSPETAMWLYRDMAGNVQGPFSSLMMHDWYSQQYFADDLLIRRQEDSEFKPLAQIVAAVGNALQPFIIPPSNWLHRPDPPRPAFDNNMATDSSLLGNEQSRFTDAFDANRPWSSGQAARQQGWPASLALGGLANGGPSPFGPSDIFAAGQAGFDNRPRNQDDLIGGGAWSVVGASGKPTTPSAAPSAGTGSAYGSAAASPLAARPALGTASRSTSGAIPTSGSGSAWNVVGKPSAPASPSPSSRVAAAPSALASATKRAALDPNAPSPEFIRYCKDNLQGLTIKTDDFIDMLLQFPLDPSADVIEIIADTVYANSSTLDGRRFAHDFVSKRKLDVHGRTGSVAASRWGAASGAGMGSFGAAKPAAAQQASPFGAKGMNAGVQPKSPDSGFRVVKSKAAKKRT